MQKHTTQTHVDLLKIRGIIEQRQYELGQPGQTLQETLAISKFILLKEKLVLTVSHATISVALRII